MRDRGRSLAARPVEIGDGIGRFRRRIAAEFVTDRAGETFLVATAPTASATATAPAAAIAVALLIATGCLLLAVLAAILLTVAVGIQPHPVTHGGGVAVTEVHVPLVLTGGEAEGRLVRRRGAVQVVGLAQVRGDVGDFHGVVAGRQLIE